MTINLLTRSLFLCKTKSVTRNARILFTPPVSKNVGVAHLSTTEYPNITPSTDSVLQSTNSTNAEDLISSKKENPPCLIDSYHDDDRHRKFECTLNRVLEMHNLGKDYDLNDTGLEELPSAIHGKIAFTQEKS